MYLRTCMYVCGACVQAFVHICLRVVHVLLHKWVNVSHMCMCVVYIACFHICVYVWVCTYVCGTYMLDTFIYVCLHAARVTCMRG